MTKTKKTAIKETFEKGLERLEAVVEDLESGEKGIDESLTLFEDGIGLAKDLTRRLEAVKQRVAVLTKEGGRFKEKPLAEDD